MPLVSSSCTFSHPADRMYQPRVRRFRSRNKSNRGPDGTAVTPALADRFTSTVFALMVLVIPYLLSKNFVVEGIIARVGWLATVLVCIRCRAVVSFGS